MGNNKNNLNITKDDIGYESSISNNTNPKDYNEMLKAFIGSNSFQSNNDSLVKSKVFEIGGNLNIKAEGDFLDKLSIKNISDSSLDLVSDLNSWKDTIVNNPIATVCCVLQYFLSVSISYGHIPRLKLLDFLALCLKNLSYDTDINLMFELKRSVTFAFKLILDTILKKTIGLIYSAMDELYNLLKPNKLLEDCFHISLIYEALKDFLNKILGLHFSIKAELPLMIDTQLALSQQLKLDFLGEYFSDFADWINSLINSINSFLDELDQKIDTCDLVKYDENLTDEVRNIINNAFIDNVIIPTVDAMKNTNYLYIGEKGIGVKAPLEEVLIKAVQQSNLGRKESTFVNGVINKNYDTDIDGNIYNRSNYTSDNVMYKILRDSKCFDDKQMKSILDYIKIYKGKK